MAFKKIFWIWLLITVVSGALFKLVALVIKGHPYWPWAVPVLYIGVLILFALYVLTKPQQK
ncbi:MAG: hypothetical protein RB296_10775 [Acidobacteriota bacterium]|jgi:hypothetical protein|nr:hypothetical protein [Acidobacteriota bacterium]